MASLVRVVTIRYQDRSGHRVPSGTPGAKKVRGLSSKWYGQGIPGWPSSKRVPLATDKIAAQRMLDDLVRRAERGQTDLPDAGAGRVPLADQLTLFAGDLALGLVSRAKGKGRRPDPKQTALVVQRVRACLDGCGFESVADLGRDAPRKLSAYLARRVAIPNTRGRLPTQIPNAQRRRWRAGKETPPPKPGPHEVSLSHQSAAFHLAAMRRFVWWLATAANAPVRADLFDSVGGFDAAANRVHLRRECPPADLARVLDAALTDTTPRRKPDGPARYHLYLLAFATGLRAEELSRLAPINLELDADPPLVILPAGRTKNKRRATQPLPLAVAVQLRRFLADKPAGQPVWPGAWQKNAAHILRRDLQAAGVPYSVNTPDGPAVLDFHALRHSFVSALAAAGVGPKELQELARHSDPRLTLGVYTHARPARLAAAVETLAIPGCGGNETKLSDLSRGDLESLAVVLLGFFDLVARRVAQNTETT